MSKGRSVLAKAAKQIKSKLRSKTQDFEMLLWGWFLGPRCFPHEQSHRQRTNDNFPY